jgi:hypothetical protein
VEFIYSWHNGNILSPVAQMDLAKKLYLVFGDFLIIKIRYCININFYVVKIKLSLYLITQPTVNTYGGMEL